MRAGTLNFDDQQATACEQGATWTKVLSLRDGNNEVMNLSDYTAKMQIRRTIGGTLITELSTDNGRIDYDSEGRIVLTLLASETTLLPAGSFLYDLKLTSAGDVLRLIEGKFVIKAQVTI